jgi:hypothetical protein
LKVMIIQPEGEARDKLEAYVKAGGAEVICSRPVWPGFFLMAKQERPDVALVDCSADPGYGRECAGYLGETGFTNQIKVLAFNVAPDEEDLMKIRAPKAKIVNLRDIGNELAKIDPGFRPPDATPA